MDKLFLIQWRNIDTKYLVKAGDFEKAKDVFIDYCERSGNLELMEDEVGVANVRISITVTVPVIVNLTV
ncbi:MAG: hypothetical protein WC708_01200 [Lentisphaeria bacterium]|jgi:hypothetical protein